jgi:hypothetical protein
VFPLVGVSKGMTVNIPPSASDKFGMLKLNYPKRGNFKPLGGVKTVANTGGVLVTVIAIV